MTTQQDALKTARSALTYASECFDCVEIEGLSQALADTADERLKDLVERRLLWATNQVPAAIAAIDATLSQKAAQESQPVMWIETEEGMRGKTLEELLAPVANKMYSCRWHHTPIKPETENPVWPLYAAPQVAALPVEVIEFLRGAAPLEGVWFGDKHPTRKSAFWWREFLHAQPPAGQAQEKDAAMAQARSFIEKQATWRIGYGGAKVATNEAAVLVNMIGCGSYPKHAGASMTDTKDAAQSERELKPCPFCGSPANDFNPDGEMEGYSIQCSGKFAIFNADESCCPLHTFSYTKNEDAITAWNRRADTGSAKAREWLSGSPTHPGWYETQRDSGGGEVVLWWRGKEWCASPSSPTHGPYFDPRRKYRAAQPKEPQA